jgi:6-phosphogluconolactonase (cycloisomerase 2 family)
MVWGTTQYAGYIKHSIERLPVRISFLKAAACMALCLLFLANTPSSGRILTYQGCIKDSANAKGLDHPQTMAISHDGKFIYVITGPMAYQRDCRVSWFSRNTADGSLTYTGMIRDSANGAVYSMYTHDIVISPDDRFVYVNTSYMFNGPLTNDHSIHWFERDLQTGALTFKDLLFPTPVRYGRNVFAGQIVFSPDGKFAYVASAWNSAVFVHSRDPVTGALTCIDSVNQGINGVTGLDIASLLAMDNEGKSLYVVDAHGTASYTNAIAWFNRNPSNGALNYLSCITDVSDSVIIAQKYSPPGITSIAVAPNGRHVYIADKSGNAIKWFGRTATDGALTYLGRTADSLSSDSLSGAGGLAITPDGDYIVAAWGTFFDGECDGWVSLYKRNKETGDINLLERYKDNEDGINSLDGAYVVSISPDGKNAYVTASNDDAINWFSITESAKTARSERRKVNRSPFLDIKQNSAGGMITIAFTLPDNSGKSSLSIYTLTGKKITTLYTGATGASSLICWNGTDDNGRHISPGTYLFKLCTPLGGNTQQCNLLR